MEGNIERIHKVTKETGISADEINCLIHAYLEDSGFAHSAYAVRMEAQLDNSPNFQKHIPRGELIELLTKALLYMEVETHWDGNNLKLDCESDFSLLDPHECRDRLPPQQSLRDSVTMSVEPSIPQDDVMQESESAVDEEPVKRKADDPLETNGRVEKRARFDTEPESIEPPEHPKPSEPVSSTTTARAEEKTNVTFTEPLVDTVAKKRSKRLPGPADDTTDPDVIQMLSAHESEVFVCAWNPAKIGLLATGSKDAVVNIWNIPGPPPNGSSVSPHCKEPPIKLSHWTKPEQADLTSLDWNPDGTLLAIGSYDAILRVCETSGNLYMSNNIHEGPIFATNFSGDGRWLLTASLDGTACVWNVQEKRLHRQYRNHLDCCLDVDWISDTMFASCGADKLIHVLQLEDTKPLRTFTGHTNEINQIKVNPTRTRLASCSDDRTARVWSLDPILTPRSPSAPMPVQDDTSFVVLKGHRGSVSSVEWCPHSVPGQNELIASSGFDGTARLWDSVTGDCLKVFMDHKRPVYALSFSPEGKWLATGSGDGWLHIYDVQTAQKTWSWFAGVQKPGVYEIDWQKNGDVNRIALALESRNVGVIDVTRIGALQDDD